MRTGLLLFSKDLRDLILAREKSEQIIRYSSDFFLLQQILEKFESHTILISRLSLDEKVKNLIEKSSSTILLYSSDTELEQHLKDLDSKSDGEIDIPSFQNLFELSPTFSRLAGFSLAMKKLRNEIIRVSAFDVSVLLLGETGTGKSTVARALHELSDRRKMPFRCEILSNTNESVIESKLFGVDEGGFTGAQKRKGVFEESNGGTLFLDEIGEISLEVQTKLLHVLSEGVISRIGSNKEIKVDNRMIFATNANLELKLKKGTFREDLFYRMNDVTITIPPLRDRLEDIPELAEAFLKRERINKRISDSALKSLQTFDWRGNIRQLEKCLKRAALIFCDGDVIEASHLKV